MISTSVRPIDGDLTAIRSLACKERFELTPQGGSYDVFGQVARHPAPRAPKWIR